MQQEKCDHDFVSVGISRDWDDPVNNTGIRRIFYKACGSNVPPLYQLQSLQGDQKQSILRLHLNPINGLLLSLNFLLPKV